MIVLRRRSIAVTPPRVAALRVGVAVAVLLAGALALFWPGYVTYDGVAQYGQALSGEYDDWHPPAMARLWSLFGAGGAAPMLALQMALYWAGLGTLAIALTLRQRRYAAFAVLLLAVWPPLLGWQAVVIKDAQMLAALLAGVGAIGWFRLRGRRVPIGAWLIAAALFAYALLVRANAVFAVIPLVVALMRWPRRIPLRIALALGGILLAIGVAGPINHRLLGGTSSGVERTQALYDLAGVAVRTGDPLPGLSDRTIATLRARGCVRAFFWDPLGEPSHCADAMASLHAMPVGTLYRTWATAIVRHPLAYAAHRLAHLNSTERWLVPVHWIGAAPPEADEANDLALRDPGRAGKRWQRLAATMVEWPSTWPVVWALLALFGLIEAGERRDGAGQLAAALFVSAGVQEASFAVVSIASDLRYHLWAMAATAIGWILLGRLPRRRWMLAALALLLSAGTAARLDLPQAPQTYRGMLG